MSYSMTRQLQVGAAGAARVKLLLARRFGELIDYEGVREKQRQGIDMFIKPWGDVEIKTDLHGTINFFLEFECSGKPSGVMTSQADFWAYYLVKPGLIYMIPLPALQEYIKSNWKWFMARYKKEVASHAGKRKWSASGFALPRDFVCAAMPVTVYEDYEDKLWLVAGQNNKKSAN